MYVINITTAAIIVQHEVGKYPAVIIRKIEAFTDDFFQTAPI